MTSLRTETDSEYTKRYVTRDARIRAWRTFWVALGFDVAATVAAFLITVVSDLEWTKTYWVAVGLGVAKSIITGVMTYFIRKFIKPSNEAR